MTGIVCQSAIESVERDHELVVARLLEDKQRAIEVSGHPRRRRVAREGGTVLLNVVLTTLEEAAEAASAVMAGDGTSL